VIALLISNIEDQNKKNIPNKLDLKKMEREPMEKILIKIKGIKI
jgi:hypothetical protein